MSVTFDFDILFPMKTKDVNYLVYILMQLKKSIVTECVKNVKLSSMRNSSIVKFIKHKI